MMKGIKRATVKKRFDMASPKWSNQDQYCFDRERNAREERSRVQEQGSD
jgi:hypothetical protein